MGHCYVHFAFVFTLTLNNYVQYYDSEGQVDLSVMSMQNDTTISKIRIHIAEMEVL